MKKRLLVALGGLLGAVAIYMALDALIVTDEELIEGLIEKACLAVEQEDLDLCVQFVSEDFKYQEKGVNKARLANLARSVFSQADNLEVNISEMQITVNGQQATVFIKFRLLGEYVGRMDQFVGERGFILGEPLKAARATLHLCKQRPPDAPASAEASWMLCAVTGFHPGYEMPARPRRE